MSKITVGDKEVFTKSGELLVSMESLEEVTKSGLIIPKTAHKETDFMGTIIKVSQFRQENNTGEGAFLQEGKKVIIRKNVGVPIQVDGISEPCRLISEKDILLYVD